MPTIRERLQARRFTKEAKKQQSREDAVWIQERYEAAKQTKRLPHEEKVLRGREKRLELKERERALEKREKEFRRPIQTRAVRRAQKVAERFLAQGEQVAQKAPKEGARKLRQVVARTRPVRKRSGFTEGAPAGRVRLPVFAEGTSMSERVATDFGMKPQSDILAPATPKEFFTNKGPELFGPGKQMDLGLGSSNGNKKKVRYY